MDFDKLDIVLIIIAVAGVIGLVEFATRAPLGSFWYWTGGLTCLGIAGITGWLFYLKQKNSNSGGKRP